MLSYKIIDHRQCLLACYISWMPFYFIHKYACARYLCTYVCMCKYIFDIFQPINSQFLRFALLLIYSLIALAYCIWILLFQGLPYGHILSSISLFMSVLNQVSCQMSQNSATLGSLKMRCIGDTAWWLMIQHV